jgi:hypothetical protein
MEEEAASPGQDTPGNGHGGNGHGGNGHGDNGYGDESYDAPMRRLVVAASSVSLAVTVSKVLFVGAVLALLLGVLAATLIYSSANDADSVTGGLGGVDKLVAAQAAITLVTALLPAGVLAASAAALRLHSARLESDVLEG